jgi:phosphoglycolate phosphatase-like HAD superfamily hydrolase
VPRLPRAVLWDLDGTLVDSSGSILCAANRALASEPGLRPLQMHELRPLIGIPIRDIFRRHLGTPDESLLDRLVGAYRAAYAGCQALTSVHAGMADLLGRVAAAGARNVVVTTKGEQVARGVLDALGLARHVSGVVGDDGRRPLKPSPVPVADACRLAGAEPGDAVLVGDTAHDAEAARGAGVAFLGVAWGYGSAEGLRKAGWTVCGDAAQLAAALGAR